VSLHREAYGKPSIRREPQAISTFLSFGKDHCTIVQCECQYIFSDYWLSKKLDNSVETANFSYLLGLHVRNRAGSARSTFRASRLFYGFIRFIHETTEPRTTELARKCPMLHGKFGRRMR
jgi:hypothetical protein